MDSSPALADLVDLYLLRCEVEGKSPRTLRAYRETLRRFLRCVDVDGPRTVTAQHLYEYLGRFTHLSLETRHRYFREVRCFFNWLVDARHLEDPFRGMRNVRLPQRIVEPFSANDIARLMASCDPETAIGTRDRAMVLCLLDTGVRCSELVQLDMQDLDPAAQRIRVRHGKGNKQRVVPFAARCAAALEHTSRSAEMLRVRSSSPPTSAAGFGRALRCSQTGSSRCCVGSGTARAFRRSTRIASATPSPPGRSRMMRVSSMSSTCSAMHHRTWSAATAPHTAQSRRRCGTIASRPPTDGRYVKHGPRSKRSRSSPISPTLHRSLTADFECAG